MNALDESMDEKLERLERENEQLRQELTKILFDSVSVLKSMQLENEQLRAENAKHKETEQELMDALGPYAMESWIHPSVHANAVAVHAKHFESMMT